jgi:hypothetical protein
MSRVEGSAENTIRTLEKKTGKTLDQWLRIAKATPLTEQREIINFLQAKCGLTSKHAHLIASKAIGQTRRQK